MTWVLPTRGPPSKRRARRAPRRARAALSEIVTGVGIGNRSDGAAPDGAGVVAGVWLAVTGGRMARLLSLLLTLTACGRSDNARAAEQQKPRAVPVVLAAAEKRDVPV